MHAFFVSNNKIQPFFIKIIVFLIVLSALTTHLKSILFIDIDEFDFPAARENGLRICYFDSNFQKYEEISYYNFDQARANRHEEVFLYDPLGFKVTCKGNIIIEPSFSKEIMVRTKGDFLAMEITEETKNLQFFQDDKGRNLAYFPCSLPVFSPDHFALHLMYSEKTVFEKLASREEMFLVDVFLPRRQPNSQFEQTRCGEFAIQVNFHHLSDDEYENRAERGRLGELATQMIFFSHGYLEKFSSQNNSNHGIDGIYAQRNERGELCGLFFTESKCHHNPPPLKSVMRDQLKENHLSSRIHCLHPLERDLILNFIYWKPILIYKVVHQVFNNGTSDWLIEPLNYPVFYLENSVRS